MDPQLSADDADRQGGFQAEHGDHPPPRPRKPGRKQKIAPQLASPVELLAKTCAHFLPGLSDQANALSDPRNPLQRVYSTAHLVWLGLCLFLMRLGSRRQLRLERRTEAFRLNFEKLCGQTDLESVADTDTLAYWAERMEPEAIGQLLAGMTRSLIRSRALDPFRLQGAFTVAIDGSQVRTFNHEPWPGCPHRRLADGTIQYFEYVLDAKLVAPCGLSLTLATEPLTNEGHAEFEKQDCELKAFYRLAPKLHSLFPRTPFILLLDALYLKQTAIRLIDSFRWKFIVNFKEGSMPERYAEAMALMEMQPENALQIRHGDVSQSFRWIHDLPVAEFSLGVIECVDQPPGKDPTRFLWATNCPFTPKTVSLIANNGGRQRWKVENEGFNAQKNEGYGMAHRFSENPNASQIFYHLLLIAHYICQLVLHGSLIESLERTFGSAKNFVRRLAESMRMSVLPDKLAIPGQIRFRPP